MEKSKVYFCKEITPSNVVKLYKTLGKELTGNVAIKVHSGEDGNQNFLRQRINRGFTRKYRCGKCGGNFKIICL